MTTITRRTALNLLNSALMAVRWKVPQRGARYNTSQEALVDYVCYPIPRTGIALGPAAPAVFLHNPLDIILASDNAPPAKLDESAGIRTVSRLGCGSQGDQLTRRP